MRQTITMIDGRVFVSDDNWATVYRQSRKGALKRLNKNEADKVRLLVAFGAAEKDDG
jgi:hypothetical protein